MAKAPIDRVVLDLWYPLGAVEDAASGKVVSTGLLEERLSYALDDAGRPRVWKTGEEAASLPFRIAYGYVWSSLGRPPPELFPIPEWDEPDRRRMNAASVGVATSAPRAIENFLDMGHFPYVHTGILGAEPHTEVKEYDVEISDERDEILATRCRFFQPMASTASSGGADVEYVYRVPHPYCAVLYKSSPLDEKRLDVIAIFLQPLDQEHTRAHMMLCILDDTNDDTVIRHFQQTIFGQDKPILENQLPKRLPLDPRAETPIRADKSSITYRRWLSRKGVTYGVIPAGT
jgi:phenylpropionate dioxygenase-like ring-hydroxylating dioxygenase large terminal subunit